MSVPGRATCLACTSSAVEVVGAAHRTYMYSVRSARKQTHVHVFYSDQHASHSPPRGLSCPSAQLVFGSAFPAHHARCYVRETTTPTTTSIPTMVATKNGRPAVDAGAT